MNKTIRWIIDDFKSYPFRFCVEFLAWFISISCAIVMAATVPDPPFMVMYPFWIMGCGMYAWSAYTRKSFGMIMNYVLLMSIDLIALFRMVSLAY
jgi:hypothetical protein